MMVLVVVKVDLEVGHNSKLLEMFLELVTMEIVAFVAEFGTWVEAEVGLYLGD